MFMTNKVMTLQQQVPKPKIGLLYNNYFLLEPCRECMCDELIKKALDLIKCLDYYWYISFNMEVKVVGFHDLFEICDEFDLKFLFLQKKHVIESY